MLTNCNNTFQLADFLFKSYWFFNFIDMFDIWNANILSYICIYVQPCAKVLGTYNFLAFYEKLNISARRNLREVFDHAFWSIKIGLSICVRIFCLLYFVPKLYIKLKNDIFAIFLFYFKFLQFNKTFIKQNLI